MKEAYRALARGLEVELAKLAYIDDTEESLGLAEKIGYKPVHFTDYTKLLEQLRELGVKTGKH